VAISLTDKSILITGAGQGIGEATAHYLADLGARVVVADVQAAKAAAVAEAVRTAGGQADSISGDVSSWDDAAALVDFTVERFGRIDGLVNNAGVIHHGSPLEETDGNGARRVFEVNLMGSYFVGLHAIRRMAETGGGSIVNVTSGVQAGLGNAASYSASKGGIASLTYSWAIDCAPLGIRVNSLSPVASTEMTLIAQQLMRDRGEFAGEAPVVPPERNCPIVAYFLSDAAADVTGQILRMHDRTLQLIGHPVVLVPEVEREQWTADDIAHAVENDFADRLPPLGLVGARSEFVQLGKVNVVPGIDLATGKPA